MKSRFPENKAHSRQVPLVRIAGILIMAMLASLPFLALPASKGPAGPGADEEAVEAADSVEACNPTRTAFELIPASDLDILTPSMRMEMIIYMENDSVYKVRNIYSGQSWIETMTQDFLDVHLTDVSSLQVKTLPYSGFKDGSNLVMTIYTISGESDTADSTIKFYRLQPSDSTQMKLTELPTKNFYRVPDPKDFYDIKAGNMKAGSEKLTLKDLLDEMPFHTIALSISPEGTKLTGRLTMSNYLTLESRRRIEPYLRPDLRWIWDGSKFRLANR